MITRMANDTFDKITFFWSLPTDSKEPGAANAIDSKPSFFLLGNVTYSSKMIKSRDKFPTSTANIRSSHSSSSEIINWSRLSSRIIKINTLKRKRLREPIEAILEPDDEGFIIRTVDLPLFGYGDDPIEAIQNLKYEIESLHDDLMKDDNFSDEWLGYKQFFKKIVCER